jgi:ribosomal protein S18 acetylase RimI-like enzyme
MASSGVHPHARPSRQVPRNPVGSPPQPSRETEHMTQVEVSVLADANADTVEVLGRLLAQVSSRGALLTAERVREVSRSPSTSILVARLDGKIVGMALLLTLTTLARTTGYVEEVVVDQAARGQHISTALMTTLLDLAVAKGLEFVDLTSRPSRNVANGLYQSLGFKRRETNCYRYDLR